MKFGCEVEGSRRRVSVFILYFLGNIFLWENQGVMSKETKEAESH